MSDRLIRKLAWFEVGKGRLNKEMQAHFETAQLEAAERNCEIKLVATIVVSPPEMQDKKFGRVSYKTHLIVPPKKSMEFTTELKDGMIVSDGEDIADILQIKMDLEIPAPQNTKPFKKESEGTHGN